MTYGSRQSAYARSVLDLDKLISKRRLIQLYSALLFNAHIKGFIRGDIYTGPLKNFCVPGLNCYSCPGAVGACPLGSMQNALSASDKKAPFFIIGILLLSGLLLGRTICGYLCPFGLIQELLHKIPVPKLRKNRITRALSYFKYVLLAVFVIAIPLYYAARSLPLPGFCKYICPAGTLEGAVALLANKANESDLSLLGLLFTRKFVILMLVLLFCMFVYRFFCRFMCPLGAIYGLFNRFSLFGVHVDESKCTSCGLCVSACQMDVKHIGDHECIHCGSCVETCPRGAITLRLGNKILKSRKVTKTQSKHKNRRDSLCALAAAALLITVLAFSNFGPGAAAGKNETVSFSDRDIPIGSLPGMLCPDIAAPLYFDKDQFRLQDCLGSVTVINFWATWCEPCCRELPYFERLSAEHPEICVVALHSNLVTDDVEAYLKDQHFTFRFGLDETGEIIDSLGGSAILPQTVVLDSSGRIVYNAVGSVTYEKLCELTDMAKASDH